MKKTLFRGIFLFLLSQTVVQVSCSKDNGNVMDFTEPDKKPDTVTAIVPSLEKSTRPILICEQSQSRVIIVDSLSQGIMWEWKASASLPASQAQWFSEPDEAKAVYNKKYVLVTSSSGGVALVRISDKKMMFYANPKGSPHSAEVLPDGNIVVACSTNGTPDGDALKIYQVDTLRAFVESEAVRYPLTFGHNVVWDKKRNRLWATDKNNLYSYSYSAEGRNPQLTADAAVHPLPGDDPHDLFPVWGKDAFYLTTGDGIYEFNISSGKFAKTAFSSNNIKSISTGPAGFGTLMLKPNQSWWSDEVMNSAGKRAFYAHGYKMYKARWFTQNSFSYPEDHQFKQSK